MTTFKQALEENKDNAEMLSAIVSECSGYNGTLEEYEWHEFGDDFFDTFFSEKQEVARAVFFGDIESWSDDYIRFNHLGNLESASSYKRDDELKENAQEIIDAGLEMRDNIDLNYVIDTYTDYDADDLTDDEEK